MSPIYLVAGLGRCGSTMVMTMLAAGGMPTIGSAPDFEDEDAIPALLRGPGHPMRGHAVKALTLHRDAALDQAGPFRGLWLDRDSRQQAASAARLLRGAAGLHISRSQVGELAALLRRDRPVALRQLRRLCGQPPLMLRFETILADPTGCARRLSEWCDRPLDEDAMAAVVRRRSPRSLAVPVELGLMNGDFHVR